MPISKRGDIPSVHSILLNHYFPITFLIKDETSYSDHIYFYFLRPEAYFTYWITITLKWLITKRGKQGSSQSHLDY